ncbi:MAG: nucleotide exchange factor GrpE [Pseudomonadota bacterium]|nr:nucleotide exchange factor GrpE [Pseudomonadota bacterium]
MNDKQPINPDAKGPEEFDNKAETAPDPHSVIEKLVSENAELKERVLRALAETENMRRRSERESADARAYGVTNFARDLLSVVDNLERALDHIPADARAGANDTLKALIEGVELTAKDLASVLARHGVKRLDPLGEKFDPNFHQAMFEAPDAEIPSGAVAQVVQSGWKIADRVLRPALVGVSKGAAKTAPTA